MAKRPSNPKKTHVSRNKKTASKAGVKPVDAKSAKKLKDVKEVKGVENTKKIKETKKPSRFRLVRKLNSVREKRKEKRISPHKSFKRTYREDYQRETKVPGMLHHIMICYKMIFKNWKLFLPLLIIAVLINVVFVGIMSEANYEKFQEIMDQTSADVTGGDIGNVAKAGLLLISTITTGGLSGESSEAAVVFGVIVFLIIWLTTIFLLRHKLAGHKVKLRDGLYNGMAPLLSSFVVFIVVLLQCIPIFALVIAYSAAVQTEFLATPFYALVFFIFAALMILLSGYLLSSSLMAFVAVSAPGMYPFRALSVASDFMMGRRVRLILRIVSLLISLAIVWVVVMLPLILFDLWMKQFEWAAGIPFVPICLTVMTCFTGIYVTTYFYMYYRWMLEN